MNYTMLKGKIHRAVVKQADLNYVGSITVDTKPVSYTHLPKGIFVISSSLKYYYLAVSFFFLFAGKMCIRDRDRARYPELR